MSPRVPLVAVLQDLAERRLLREVAAEAGLAPSTLSRIAHGTRGPTAHVREEVLAALTRLAARRADEAAALRAHAKALRATKGAGG